MPHRTATLFDPIHVGDLALANRIVMAPLTRNRAPDAVPTKLMAQYYTQRASAGLTITEATAISQQGQGYADVPGLYAEEQVEAWKDVTRSVHAAGGKIVCQLWHVGRISHTSLQPNGAQPVAPSAITANTKTVLLKNGVPEFVPVSEPRALQAYELPDIVHTYVAAARNAVHTAGFDGVEIHAANGYLLDQFLKSGSNQRRDDFGGSIENRARFQTNERQEAGVESNDPSFRAFFRLPLKPGSRRGTNQLVSINRNGLKIQDNSPCGQMKPNQVEIFFLKSVFGLQFSPCFPRSDPGRLK